MATRKPSRSIRRPDDGRAEGGMVDVGVAGHEDDVDIVPVAGVQLVARVVGSQRDGSQSGS
jgi:hypothetical protein